MCAKWYRISYHQASWVTTLTWNGCANAACFMHRHQVHLAWKHNSAAFRPWYPRVHRAKFPPKFVPCFSEYSQRSLVFLGLLFWWVTISLHVLAPVYSVYFAQIARLPKDEAARIVIVSSSIFLPVLVFRKKFSEKRNGVLIFKIFADYELEFTLFCFLRDISVASAWQATKQALNFCIDLFEHMRDIVQKRIQIVFLFREIGGLKINSFSFLSYYFMGIWHQTT